MAVRFWYQRPGDEEAGWHQVATLAEVPAGASSIEVDAGTPTEQHIYFVDGPLVEKPSWMSGEDYALTQRTLIQAGGRWVQPAAVGDYIGAKYAAQLGNSADFFDRYGMKIVLGAFALVTGGVGILGALSEAAGVTTTALEFGATGLTEGLTLASDAGFVPGSFELGANSLGSSAVDFSLDSLAELGYDAFQLDTPLTLPDGQGIPDWLQQVPDGDAALDPNASGGGPAASNPPSYNPITAKPFSSSLLDQFTPSNALSAVKTGAALLTSAAGANAVNRQLAARSTLAANALPFQFAIAPGRLNPTGATVAGAPAGATDAGGALVLAALGLGLFFVMK